MPPLEATLGEFGRRVAVLARPNPSWSFVVGREASDGILSCVDLHYHENDEARLTVRTTRTAPASARVWPTFSPDAFLASFVDNRGHTSVPVSATERRPADGFLSVAGHDLPATALTAAGVFAFTATGGDEIFAVAGLTGLEHLARDLAFAEQPSPPR
ncbi:hypothetical protein [Kitasatospora purpeofusca]|uniref:hypothetical protein n=1 Tax=Kitasatospora purpeofusca TaxID=67352 RepID=UPI0036CD897E